MRIEAFSLRYRAYSSAGLIGERSNGLFYDQWDNTSTQILWGIRFRGHLVGSIRTTWGANIPELSAYPHFVNQFAGRPDCVSGNRLVIEPKLRGRNMSLLLALLRLHLMASNELAPHAVCAVRQPHVEFYRRVLVMEPSGEPQTYPELNCKMQLLYGRTISLHETVYRQSPSLSPRESERRLLSETFRDEWEAGFGC